MGLQVVTGSWYLGVFIGDGASEKRWLAGKVEGWAESVGTLVGVDHKQPQSAYAILQKSLQQEWAFLQRVNSGIGDAFGLVEKLLQENFLPDLFKGLGVGAPGRWVTRLPVKQAGMALLDLTLTPPENCKASCVIIGHTIEALRVQVEFWTADQLACLQEGRTAVWKKSSQKSAHRAEEALMTTIAGAPVQGTGQIQWVTKTGAWMMVQPSMVNGTELGAQEWRYALFLKYGLEPSDFPNYCDGCNAKFSICHTLDCKRGSLVTLHHNELRDWVTDLARKAFTPSHVLNNPLIFASCVVKRPKAKPSRTTCSTDGNKALTPEATEQKGDLLIRNL